MCRSVHQRRGRTGRAGPDSVSAPGREPGASAGDGRSSSVPPLLPGVAGGRPGRTGPCHDGPARRGSFDRTRPRGSCCTATSRGCGRHGAAADTGCGRHEAAPGPAPRQPRAQYPRVDRRSMRARPPLDWRRDAVAAGRLLRGCRRRDVGGRGAGRRRSCWRPPGRSCPRLRCARPPRHGGRCGRRRRELAGGDEAAAVAVSSVVCRVPGWAAVTAGIRRR